MEFDFPIEGDEVEYASNIFNKPFFFTRPWLEIGEQEFYIDVLLDAYARIACFFKKTEGDHR